MQSKIHKLKKPGGWERPPKDRGGRNHGEKGCAGVKKGEMWGDPGKQANEESSGNQDQEKSWKQAPG